MAKNVPNPNKPRLSIREYLALWDNQSGWERPISIEERDLAILWLDDPEDVNLLAKKGVSIDDLFNVILDADPQHGTVAGYYEHAIDTVCFDLISAIQEDLELKAQHPHLGARSGDTIKPMLIARITLALMEIVQTYNLQMPSGLFSLIQLHTDSTLLDPNPRTKTDSQRMQAVREVRKNPEISSRALARICGVNQSTIVRWRKADWFKRLIKSDWIR